MWIARFEAIANRCRWSENDKLLQLLPRLEDEAADFAFVQLHPSVLDEYNLLIAEMDHRFGPLKQRGHGLQSSTGEGRNLAKG